MDYVTLGRTGLRVSVAGLGGGGPSQLGLRGAASEDDAVAVVRRALDLGVNVIDTAESYRSEPAIGRAVADAACRDKVVVATKASCWEGTWDRPEGLIRPADLARALEGSLSRLGTDYVDIYQLHALHGRLYRQAVETLVPAMERLREQGKVRFIGVTEEFITDPGHEMLQMAVRDDCWDVMMVGFNLLNQSARDRVFAHTRARGVGTLIMFAVRRALSRPEKLRELLVRLIAEGRVDASQLDRSDPLGFLLDGAAESVPDAAYRYCRHEPGADVVLFGTGRVEHVEANVASLLRPDLLPPLRARLEDLFARVDHVSGN